MQKHRKMIILALLLALVLTGCSHAKRQEASNTSNSPAQEEAPIVLETVPELSDASESALEAVGEDAAHEAETTGDEPSQPETEASIDNPFETEHVPALRTLKNGETIELLETKAFGALTARYYACASGTIENGAWTECLEIATPPEAVETSVPEGLSFEPFSACAYSCLLYTSPSPRDS